MHRALWEFRIRGVVTNLRFLDQLITHRASPADYTTRFIEETPELFHSPRKRDRATRILSFIGATIVNGNPGVKGRAVRRTSPRRGCRRCRSPRPPLAASSGWRSSGRSVLRSGCSLSRACCSPTPRCAMRTSRCSRRGCARSTWRRSRRTTRACCHSCSRWNAGAGRTFDVALRFLREDPWERLALLRERLPNLLLQMLLRSANAVGYANYPDNVVRFFVARAAARGIDVFRIFDSLNWVENMRVAIDAVLEAGKLCEGLDLLHGKLERSAREEVHARLLPSSWRASSRPPAPMCWASRTWRAWCGRGPLHPGEGAQGRDRPAGAFPHP